MTPGATFDPSPVNVRTKISAMWASMLFVFVYIDHYGFYRPDVREAIESGEVSGFTIGPGFLLGTTIYILVPSLMVVASLVLRPSATRVANLVLAAVYAVTIVAAAVGEWEYYLLGSVVEIGLLAAIAHQAWTWPRLAAQPSAAPTGGDERVGASS